MIKWQEIIFKNSSYLSFLSVWIMWKSQCVWKIILQTPLKNNLHGLFRPSESSCMNGKMSQLVLATELRTMFELEDTRETQFSKVFFFFFQVSSFFMANFVLNSDLNVSIHSASLTSIWSALWLSVAQAIITGVFPSSPSKSALVWGWERSSCWRYMFFFFSSVNWLPKLFSVSFLDCTYRNCEMHIYSFLF